MPDKTVKSLPELISQVLKDTAEINKPIWYRGHGNSDYELLPSFHRPDIAKMSELEYIKKFKQDAKLLADSPKPEKDYEWLFLMRHYETPTRLLDWSENALTAAFFSVKDSVNTREHDGVFWILLPLELNKLSRVDTLPSFDENEIETSPYLPKSSELSRATKTLAILAPRNSMRMQAQQSVFTIDAHNNTIPLECQMDGYLWKYIIPKEFKEKIRKELKLIGINIFQLYPELERIHEKLEGN